MHPVEFMKSMRDQFGTFEFRASTDKTIVESKGCPVNPRHPFNRPDSEYIIPAIDLERMEANKQ